MTKACAVAWVRSAALRWIRAVQEDWHYPADLDVRGRAAGMSPFHRSKVFQFCFPKRRSELPVLEEFGVDSFFGPQRFP